MVSIRIRNHIAYDDVHMMFLLRTWDPSDSRWKTTKFSFWQLFQTFLLQSLYLLLPSSFSFCLFFFLFFFTYLSYVFRYVAIPYIAQRNFYCTLYSRIFNISRRVRCLKLQRRNLKSLMDRRPSKKGRKKNRFRTVTEKNIWRWSHFYCQVPWPVGGLWWVLECINAY